MSPLFVAGLSSLGAVLELKSPGESHIAFSDGSNVAKLSATCATATPAISSVLGQPPFNSDGNLTVTFRHVLATCIDQDVSTTPCARDSPNEDALFWCTYTSTDSSTVLTPVLKGPFSAYTELIAKHGISLGLSVKLACPWPTVDEAVALGYTGVTGKHSFTLGVAYGPAGTSPISFGGLAGRDVAEVGSLPTPPSTPPLHPPPMPPPPPMLPNIAPPWGGGSYTNIPELNIGYPYGTHANEEPGTSHGSGSYDSGQGWSAVNNIYPNGYILDAAQGSNKDYYIYGVAIRARAGSSQHITAVRVSVATNEETHIAISDFAPNSGNLGSSRQAKPSSSNYGTMTTLPGPTAFKMVCTDGLCDSAPDPYPGGDVSGSTNPDDSAPGQKWSSLGTGLNAIMFDTPVLGRYVQVHVEGYAEHMSSRIGLYVGDEAA